MPADEACASRAGLVVFVPDKTSQAAATRAVGAVGARAQPAIALPPGSSGAPPGSVTCVHRLPADRCRDAISVAVFFLTSELDTFRYFQNHGSIVAAAHDRRPARADRGHASVRAVWMGPSAERPRNGFRGLPIRRRQGACRAPDDPEPRPRERRGPSAPPTGRSGRPAAPADCIHPLSSFPARRTRR